VHMCRNANEETLTTYAPIHNAHTQCTNTQSMNHYKFSNINFGRMSIPQTVSQWDSRRNNLYRSWALCGSLTHVTPALLQQLPPISLCIYGSLECSELLHAI